MAEFNLPAAISAYLELLKRSLLNEIYAPHEYSRRTIPSAVAKIANFENDEFIAKPRVIDPEAREFGRIWPPSPMAYSMIGRKRLENIQYCIEQVIADSIPGDLIETGVWRGGAAIFMRGTLLAYNDLERTVWVADSFEGLPRPDGTYEADNGDVHHTIPELAVSLEQVRDNFQRFGLLDDRVKFLKGWFADTLKRAPISQLAILRLDGDMYGSTMDALEALYDKVSSGGYIIIDDYCLPPCRKAVEDFRVSRNIDDKIQDIDLTGAYWRKS
jgi:hypothetical protein